MDTKASFFQTVIVGRSLLGMTLLLDTVSAEK